MRKIFALLTLFFLVTAQAQWKPNFDKEDKNNAEDQKRLSYGYFLGLNYFDFKLHPSEYGIGEEGRFTVESEGGMGFSAGLMGKMKINEYFDMFVQPGVHFTERKFYFNDVRANAAFENPYSGDIYVASAQDSVRDVKSTYIDIPIFLQVHGDRWFNTRPYLQAGVGYMINMQSEESSEDDNFDGVFRLKTHSFSYQVEAGMSIYFRRFKLTPSVKGIFFFNNELVADDPATPPIWAGSLKSVHSRAVLFSIKFE
ncbi:MAG: porin family protein [Flavobacteriaceae bacterium]|nr:porin family protein [Flavobacteriaceae bacterium]